MKLQNFRESLGAGVLPEGLDAPLRAMWLDASGDWHSAHSAVQHLSGRNAQWVHAYLHRKEGDLPNAAYWYRLADRVMPAGSPDLEWSKITRTLLSIQAREQRL